ncbi:hypothetical protein GOZ80_06045 [Agrobacterium vitis]|uniref:hypothetical protein n=1 Tax=Agrobacterium vitis TaxID=373 RepID=UPI0012E95A31|nr:hypothetical protein [Agrobacterium vitis]MVA91581.1 hypothetical protein [Agrobacterium vitis]MVB00514.1 hypothetical protein [Agrobacterium vitis]
MTRLARAPVSSFRADGSVLDMVAPDVGEVCVYKMAAGLSRINRYNGVPEAGGFSVAQHSVMGTEALLHERVDPIVAALFLLHDGHEYVVGDWTRPAQDALAAIITQQTADPAYAVAFRRAMLTLKTGWDTVIYTALGLPAPAAWRNNHRKLVHDMDLMMLGAEARALFLRGQELYPIGKYPQPKLKGAITPWGPAKAEEAFIKLAIRLLGQDRIDACRLAHLAHISKSAKGR